MNDVTGKASTFRTVVAALLDFFTVFFVAGFAIASFTGDLTEDGFQLRGFPAFVCFAIIVIYFVVGRKYLGGTLWQRILNAK